MVRSGEKNFVGEPPRFKPTCRETMYIHKPYIHTQTHTHIHTHRNNYVVSIMLVYLICVKKNIYIYIYVVLNNRDKVTLYIYI